MTTATLYVLFLTFCGTHAPYNCTEVRTAQFAQQEECFDADAKYVEPGAPATFDEQGRILDAAICRRVDEKQD